MNNNHDGLPQRILDWATRSSCYEKTGYSPPSLEDVIRLCQDADKADDISYLIEHFTLDDLHSDATVPPVLTELDEQVEQLTSKVDRLKQQLKDKEEVVQRESIQLLQTENEQNELREMSKEAEEQRCLQDAANHRIEEEIRVLEASEEAFVSILNKLEKKTMCPETSRNDTSKVREACQLIQRQLYPKESDTEQAEMRQKLDEDVRRIAEEILDETSAPEVYNCLVKLTAENADSLRQQIVLDEDTTSEHQARLSQLSESFAETTVLVKLESDIGRIRAELVKLDQSVAEKVEAMGEGGADSEAVELKKQIIKAEVKEASLKARIEHLRTMKASMDLEIPELQKKLPRDLDEEIVKAMQTLKKKQSQLKSVVSDYQVSCQRLEERQLEVRGNLEKTCSASNVEAILRDFETFRSDLNKQVKSLLDDLKQMPDAAAENADDSLPTLERASDQEVTVEHLEWLICWLDWLSEEIERDPASNCEEFTKLIQLVQNTNREKLEVLLPQIQALQEKASVCLGEDLMAVVNEWEEQPAKNIDIGVTVDGKTLKEILQLSKISKT